MRAPFRNTDAMKQNLIALIMTHTILTASSKTRVVRIAQVIALLLTLACSHAFAQQNSSTKRQKLPSPERIVNDYLKAIGGKKRVAAIKDATYEWTIVQDLSLNNRPRTYITQLKAPASMRMFVVYRDEQRTTGDVKTVESVTKEPTHDESGVNMRSAWARDVTGLTTLTDAAAQTAKLYAMLDASHLLDYKKARILARTVGLEEEAGETAYVVEFSLRNGARVRYLFSVSSKLLLATVDGAQTFRRTFAGYKDENGVLEPHEVKRRFPGWEVYLSLKLQSVRYNTGLNDSIFDPPVTESIEVAAVLRELDRNQETIDERVGEYTYTEKLTERKINDKGEVTEETVKLFEVYPVPDGGDVRKLISENGVLLSAEKAAKEEKRATEELEKAQRERAKTAEKRERAKQSGKKEKSDDDDLGVADFLRVAELVSPRREKLRDRDAIVFDFRPRAGYKPKNRLESIVSKLAGVMWIDPVDKQVMRLEARLIESYKMGGGLLASVRPGTALVFEQKRMEDGVWLPVYTQANISAKVFLFKGINVNVVQEFSNYHRFKTNVEDYKLTSPDAKSTASPKP